jgi:hypothetical protein
MLGIERQKRKNNGEAEDIHRNDQENRQQWRREPAFLVSCCSRLGKFHTTILARCADRAATPVNKESLKGKSCNKYRH